MRATAERTKVVKLRISNKKLMIEIRRYNQTTRDRNCLSCGSNQIEDEVHFLFNCSKYSLIRSNFYNKVKTLQETLIPNITQLAVNILINELINTSNYYINIQFMKYISACLDFRDELFTK